MKGDWLDSLRVGEVWRNPRTPHSALRTPHLAHGAFTLLEMLMVLLIIGLLAGLTLPALKGLGQSNALAAASRQLADDLSYARMSAISGRTTVYVVFDDPLLINRLRSWLQSSPPPSPAQKKLATNLISGQFTAYALIAKRTVGDQPGRPTARYLTEWKRLPDGVFIPARKFGLGAISLNPTNNPFARTAYPLPVPTSHSLSPAAVPPLPYVAFDAQGRLTWDLAGTEIHPSVDEIIPLARGSIFPPRDTAGQPVFNGSPDIVEVPPGNATNLTYQIRINDMTGRARIEKLEVQ